LVEAADQRMLTLQEHKLLYDRAYVPEHLPDYVEAISGAEPFLQGDYLCFLRTGHLIFVGYPLHDKSEAAPQAYESACTRFRPVTAAIITPGIWVDTAQLNEVIKDSYYKLELPLAPLKADLSYMIRRAGRELRVLQGTFGEEHQSLIRSFVEARQFSAGHREVFEQIPKYLAHSSTATVLEARKGQELAAFNIIDSGSADHCFYLFNFRSLKINVPGASDLLFHEMTRLAEDGEKRAMNLGLGINPGVRRFKEKWGAVPFLPYESAFVRRRSMGLFSFMRRY
jgi:hypothetical protein